MSSALINTEWPYPLLAVAESHIRGGNQAWLLDDPDALWLVRSGQVELFLVERQVEGGAGIRHHLASVSPGGLLLGSPPPEDNDFALLAVPHVDTQLLLWPRATLTEAAVDDALCPLLTAGLALWARALARGMARWVKPRPAIHCGIKAGETLPLELLQRVSARQDLLWVRAQPPNALYLDLQDVPETGYFPLSPESWLLATDDLELTAIPTREALSTGVAWSGLDQLQQMLLLTAELSLRLLNVDEFNRLDARERANAADRQRAFQALMAVTAPRATTAATPAPGTSALLSAVQRLGHEQGFAVRAPTQPEASTPPSLADILRASGLRQRQVRLRDAWWREDFGALLVFEADTERPLVLLAGPRLLDPVSGRRLDLKTWRERLSPQAVELYAPLPLRAMRGGELFGLILQQGRRDLLPMLLMGLVLGLIGLATPVATAYLIDGVIPNRELGALLELGVVLAVLGGASVIATQVRILAFARAESRIGRALQSGLMDRLLRLPMRFFQAYSTGDLSNRVMAIVQIQQLLSTAGVNAILSGLFGLLSFALMFYYDTRLALWVSLLILVYLSLSLLLAALRLHEERPLARLEGQLNDRLLQLILGVTKIRLAAAEDRAFARWAELFARSRRRQFATGRLVATQNMLNQILGLSGLLLLIVLIGKPSQAESLIAIGAFAALLSAFQSFSASLSGLLQVGVGLIAIQPQLERLAPLLAATPEVSEGGVDPGSLTGAIEVTRLSFRYTPDGPLILHELSLEVAPGEFIALVGPSGSGKSTLLRLLLGFEQPESGGIFYDGQVLDSLDRAAVRRQLGVVMQNAQPMPGSLYQNIAGVSGATLDEAWEAARRVGLTEDIQSMPMGMQTMILEGGGALSVGQMQRLMLARAIVRQPQILLLDEATSALDNRTQAVVTDSLDRLKVTRIVIAHRLSTVINADRIDVMEAGRLIESGRYQELMDRQGAFARLAERQML